MKNRTGSRMRLLMLTALLFACAQGARADIYAYTDAQGVVHFSNVRSGKGERLVIASQREGNAPAEPRALAQAFRDGQTRFAPIVEEAARAYRVDAALLHAVIAAESGYDPAAVSRKGATGLMQLMPETARRFGVENRLDPAQNIRGGAQYLSHLLTLFDQNLELALAAYNAGEHAVIRHGYTVPPYRETRGYVPKVMGLHKKYRAIL
jgi:soluble lytic murein transglycosylase-like protein